MVAGNAADGQPAVAIRGSRRVALAVRDLSSSMGTGMVMTAATATLLGPLLGVRLSLPAGTDERGEMRLLSCNIHRQQVNPEQLATFIGSTGPDVVVLQDWSSAEHDSLFAGPGWHVRRDGQLLIASHFPIARVYVRGFRRWGWTAARDERSAAACYDLQSPTGPIRLINVHLASPHTGMLTFLQDHGRQLDDNADRRWRESATLRNLVEIVDRSGCSRRRLQYHRRQPPSSASSGPTLPTRSPIAAWGSGIPI